MWPLYSDPMKNSSRLNWNIKIATKKLLFLDIVLYFILKSLFPLWPPLLSFFNCSLDFFISL